jgi:signal peptidase I
MTPPPEQPVTHHALETVQTVLLALLLALVFRTFLVQAYVIPSGSMATTLLGAHLRLRCQECGADFEVNYPAPNVAEDTPELPRRTGANTILGMTCKNCGFKVPVDTADPAQSARNTPVRYGDRILVLKSAYVLTAPRRWDVVVFISPWSASRPRDYDYDQNFIKRLVGLPGESLMVLDGDVYRGVLAPDGGRAWEICPKPRRVQKDLWRTVYDNDYYPANAARRGWTFPWRPAGGTGWNADIPGGPGRVLRFENPAGAGALAFDKDANPGTWPLTDWLAYDVTKPLHPPDGALLRGDYYELDAYGGEAVPRWHVSDLKLQFLYHRQSGTGPLRASLGKLGHTFAAELSDGAARLYHEFPDGRARELIGAALLPTGPVFVELANVDYQVTLRLNDAEVARTTPAQYAPDVPDLLARWRRQNDRTLTRTQMRDVFPAPTVHQPPEPVARHLLHAAVPRRPAGLVAAPAAGRPGQPRPPQVSGRG